MARVHCRRLCLYIVCSLLLGLAHPANGQQKPPTNDSSAGPAGVAPDRALSRRSGPRTNVRFQCGAASTDPTNHAMTVTVQYRNEGRSAVLVKFRLKVLINNDPPSSYEYSSDKPLEAGEQSEYPVSVLQGEHEDPQGGVVPEQVPTASIECRVENVQVCPVATSTGSAEAEQSGSSANQTCIAEASITRKMNLPEDKKWNCIEVDDGGKNCTVIARPPDNCVASICMGDMVWVTLARQWFAFDGADWTACHAVDYYAEPNLIWPLCATAVRARQAGFTPGEYVPL